MSSAADRLAAAKSELENYYSSSIAALIKRAPSDSPSARERLAAAKEQLEAGLAGLMKRDSLSAADRLSAAKDQLEASFSGLSKRDGSSAADRLAAAKDQLEATFSGLSKRDGLSAADRLAAAKDQLESTFSGLSKRDGASAADRLAAAKQGLEDAFNGATVALTRRADDSKETAVGDPEMPVSNFQKTVVPIVIGLILLALFAVAGGIIVYRRRKKNKAAESDSHRRKNLDLEDDGADEDYGYELPQNQRVQNVGFGGSGAAVETGRKRTNSLKAAEAQAESKADEPRLQNSKEFV